PSAPTASFRPQPAARPTPATPFRLRRRCSDSPTVTSSRQEAPRAPATPPTSSRATPSAPTGEATSTVEVDRTPPTSPLSRPREPKLAGHNRNVAFTLAAGGTPSLPARLPVAISA